MHPPITKAIFPVGGLGTRFLPATKAIPKEMLPIIDKPVIQYLVEEAVNSGIKEIIFVTGQGKNAIQNHFDRSFGLEQILQERKKTTLVKQIQKISHLAKFFYVRQEKPLGDGHAVLCAKEVLDDEPFAVIFGDDLIDSKVPALKQLLQTYQQFGKSVIALEKIPRAQTSSYGIIKPTKTNRKLPPRTHLIENLVEKPAPEKAPSNLGIIGKYILTPEALKTLNQSKPGQDGELRLIDGFRNLIQTDQIYGLEIEGQRFDTGNKVGFLEATLHYAVKQNLLKAQISS